jgi:hypothetical protein
MKNDVETQETQIPLESDVKERVSSHIHESFTLSEEDERLFQKLLKLRSSINSSFKPKFKIETMKNVIKSSEVIKFTAVHDEHVDKSVPVFRFTFKSFPKKYLEELSASNDVLKCIEKKYCPTEEENSSLLNELTHIRTSIISREIFSKYLDALMDAYEKHFENDEELKKEYQDSYEEIFELIPEKQAKEFICSGIFHLRFYPSSLTNGQFEFVF